MNRIDTIALTLFFAVVLAPLAMAADIADARTSLTSGKYDEAFEQASLIGNAEALLLGAEALNTKILLGQSLDAKDDSKKAMRIAEGILAADLDNSQAKLLYAISYGFYGRSVSPLTAWRKKMPQKIEAAILEAIKSNPDNANSYALYAGWHMGVCAKAGTNTALRNYQATIDDGVANFEKAISLSPGNMMIHANYALMLFATDAEYYRPRIDQLSAKIRTGTALNAAEKYVQNLALNILNNRDTPKDALKAAENFLGW